MTQALECMVNRGVYGWLNSSWRWPPLTLGKLGLRTAIMKVTEGSHVQQVTFLLLQAWTMISVLVFKAGDLGTKPSPWFSFDPFLWPSSLVSFCARTADFFCIIWQVWQHCSGLQTGMELDPPGERAWLRIPIRASSPSPKAQLKGLIDLERPPLEVTMAGL